MKNNIAMKNKKACEKNEYISGYHLGRGARGMWASLGKPRAIQGWESLV